MIAMLDQVDNTHGSLIEKSWHLERPSSTSKA
jgi:hypothetical protein